MKHLLTFLFVLLCICTFGQTSNETEASLLKRILAEPSEQEINAVLAERRALDLSPKEVVVRDTTTLANGNRLYILSHRVEGRLHYGAVIVPTTSGRRKLPVVIFATGGDGMSTAFDFTQ